MVISNFRIFYLIVFHHTINFMLHSGRIMKKKIILIVFFNFCSKPAFGQEPYHTRLKTQSSTFLSRTFFNFNFGGIYYPFSDENLADGYRSTGTKMNAFSARLLLGYHLSPNLDVQFGTMRPASWFKFKGIQHKGPESSVWVNLWSLSLKQKVKIAPKTDVFFEAGLGNLTRVGIYDDTNGKPIYDSAHYMTGVFGAGIQRVLSPKWDLLLSTTYLPKSIKKNQPFTFQTTVGASYNLQKIPETDAQKYSADTSYFFPEQIFQLGFGTGEIGFFTNRFFSAQAKVGNFESLGIPIFWYGDVKAKSVFSATYQRTAFRTRRYFSLDWGASATYFKSYAGSPVWAVSVFPNIRFYLFRTRDFDFYTNYSVIGPTYISASTIDGIKTGTSFTYQDFMGFGVFFGSSRQYNFDVKIMHYSNGNIFTENAGVAIPLLFSVGLTK